MAQTAGTPAPESPTPASQFPASQFPASQIPACQRCGRDGEHDFGDFWVCTDCYHIAGSTCSGFARPAGGPAFETAAADPVC